MGKIFQKMSFFFFFDMLLLKSDTVGITQYFMLENGKFTSILASTFAYSNVGRGSISIKQQT